MQILIHTNIVFMVFEGKYYPTSFPGSLIFPPSLAPGGEKMTNPGNEVFVLEKNYCTCRLAF